jgi:hypothetical protein
MCESLSVLRYAMLVIVAVVVVVMSPLFFDRETRPVVPSTLLATLILMLDYFHFSTELYPIRHYGRRFKTKKKYSGWLCYELRLVFVIADSVNYWGFPKISRYDAVGNRLECFFFPRISLHSAGSLSARTI